MDTDTSSTESDQKCGGLGKFEYSLKGLPHALLHMPELVVRGGHHGAFCTFLGEVSHKYNIKMSAKLARTYGSQNLSQEKMLQLMLTQEIYRAAIKLSADISKKIPTDSESSVREQADPVETTTATSSSSVTRSLADRLPYMENWWRLLEPPSVAWESVFLSKKARITRGEVLKLLCRKLEIDQDHRSERARVFQHLQWECFGSLIEKDDTLKRKFVGISRESSNRRDFVRLKTPTGPDSRTCLSCEIILFIQISGFTTDNEEGGVTLPTDYRVPPTNTDSVVFALIRWLSPHPDAIVRDSKLRPICPPPLDINHALWTYTEETRSLLTQPIIDRQLMYFPGSNIQERLDNTTLERKAMFDLVLPESFETFMNCTICDTTTDTKVILETITLPF